MQNGKKINTILPFFLSVFGKKKNVIGNLYKFRETYIITLPLFCDILSHHTKRSKRKNFFKKFLTQRVVFIVSWICPFFRNVTTNERRYINIDVIHHVNFTKINAISTV